TTSDAGATWTESTSPQVSAETGDAAYALDGNRWFVAAAGRNFHIYSTGDAGQSWKDLSATGLGSSWTANWLHFTNRTHGVLSVGLGSEYPGAWALMLTSDGGLSWRPATFGAVLPAYQPSASVAP
ncbi:MAG TPA: hypothetical protein VF375_09125, partial [Candidatus Limnocylindrales bacterium]